MSLNRFSVQQNFFGVAAGELGPITSEEELIGRKMQKVATW